MADKKITELTAYTTPIATDVLPIVDVTSGITKKVNKSDLTSDKVTGNGAITPATKTKITYDAKGLVTVGADANLDDLGDVNVPAPVVNNVLSWNGSAWVDTPSPLHNDLLGLQGGSSTERYHLTAAQATVVGNTTGTNTGDNTIATGLKSATTDVIVSAATAPTNGQVLTASNTTTAAWVTPSASVTVTAAPASDHLASGIKIVLTATANIAFGDVCYIASTGKASLIDADAIASMSGLFMCADATISADASGNFLCLGIARDDTWAWTVGGTIYGTITGTTGNTLSQTMPTGVDDVVQILGVATHADRIYFAPSLSQVERM